MTNQEINEAVARVDGWKESKFSLKHIKVWYARNEDYLVYVLPPYTAAYEAIIPVIQEQANYIKILVEDLIEPDFLYDATPLQLCIALLKATNNFKE